MKEKMGESIDSDKNQWTLFGPLDIPMGTLWFKIGGGDKGELLGFKGSKYRS